MRWIESTVLVALFLSLLLVAVVQIVLRNAGELLYGLSWVAELVNMWVVWTFLQIAITNSGGFSMGPLLGRRIREYVGPVDYFHRCDDCSSSKRAHSSGLYGKIPARELVTDHQDFCQFLCRCHLLGCLLLFGQFRDLGISIQKSRDWRHSILGAGFDHSTCLFCHGITICP